MAKDSKSEVALRLPVASTRLKGYELELIKQGNVSLDDDGRLHVNVWLGKAEAEAYCRLRAGLREARATTSEGKPVFSNNDVLRWLLQQVVSQSA